MRLHRPTMLAVAMVGIAAMAHAETCNAGHGCSVTCADGCSAVYNHDTGQCSTACGDEARALVHKSFSLRAHHDITLTVRALKGYKTQEKVDYTPTSQPPQTPAKPQ